MIRRTVLTLAGAALLAVPAIVAPTMLSPAAAQASLNIGLSVPGPAPMYEPIPVGGPAYAWGGGYRHWDGDGGWDHRHWGWEHRRHEERWEHRHPFYERRHW